MRVAASLTVDVIIHPRINFVDFLPVRFGVDINLCLFLRDEAIESRVEDADYF